MQALEGEEERKEANQLRVELVAENGHGQERLCKRNPGSFVQPLKG